MNLAHGNYSTAALLRGSVIQQNVRVCRRRGACGERMRPAAPQTTQLRSGVAVMQQNISSGAGPGSAGAPPRISTVA